MTDARATRRGQLIARIAQGSTTGGEVYLIAEIGSNHGGDLETAQAYIRACAGAGVDAVKFQSWQSAALQNPLDPLTLAPDAATPILRRYELPAEWHAELKRCCDEAGVDFLSTPFDPERARLLRESGAPAIKIASGDLTYTDLLREVAEYGLPVLLSTGMATLAEIETALRNLGPAAQRTILLHCIGNYPPAVEDADLRSVATLRARFGRPVGFSDHYPGHTGVIAAVALGARVIEKHVTFSRQAGHPDSPFALEMDELSALVGEVRWLERALGDGDKRCRPSEAGGVIGGRRSLYWAADLPAGSVIAREHLNVVRPNRGEFQPADRDGLIGKVLAVPVHAAHPVRRADLLDG